ncbi:MAG TPA: tetratricopeptide repeat protein [Caldilineae bacterium]|nr:tetratricopeptide repeat protein [Caldilineae bacterium]
MPKRGSRPRKKQRKQRKRTDHDETLRAAQELCWQAVADYERGDYERAIARLREALRRRPRLWDAHFLLGACYHKLGRLEEAAWEAEAELRAHPDHVLALSLLGQVRLSQGRVSEALAALERAHQLDPGDAEIQRYLYRARIQAFEQERREVSVPAEPPAKWPSISVCMIVRDEEATLGRCLDSLRDLASQIVIVDTGSQDRTVEVARARGAEVHSFEWVGDFSAARNESLRYARGEWILWLDADDELSPQAVAQIKYVVASGWADAYTFRVISPLPDGTQDIGFHTRLFRNGLGIRFYGRIHESVYPDLVSKGIRSLDTDITVVHHGYESDPAALKRKHERNLPYLEQELERHPDNASLWCYVGLARLSLGDEVGGEEALWRVIEAQPLGLYFDQYRFWAWASLLRLYMRRGEDATVHELLEKALGEFPQHPYLVAIQGGVAVKAGDVAGGLQLLTEAHERHDAPIYGLRPNRKLLALQIAACHMMLGRSEEGEKWLEQAGEVGSAEIGAYIRWLVALCAHRRDLGAEKALEKAQQRWSRDPEMWKEVALAYEKAGWNAAAYGAWMQAIECGLPNEEAVPRMMALSANAVAVEADDGPDRLSFLVGRGMLDLQAGRYIEAAGRFAELVGVSPKDPQAYRYLAVALQKMGRVEDAIQVWQAARVMDS